MSARTRKPSQTPFPPVDPTVDCRMFCQALWETLAPWADPRSPRGLAVLVVGVLLPPVPPPPRPVRSDPSSAGRPGRLSPLRSAVEDTGLPAPPHRRPLGRGCLDRVSGRSPADLSHPSVGPASFPSSGGHRADPGRRPSGMQTSRRTVHRTGLSPRHATRPTTSPPENGPPDRGHRRGLTPAAVFVLRHVAGETHTGHRG